jgi:hypothetical protein
MICPRDVLFQFSQSSDLIIRGLGRLRYLSTILVFRYEKLFWLFLIWICSQNVVLRRTVRDFRSSDCWEVVSEIGRWNQTRNSVITWWDMVRKESGVWLFWCFDRSPYQEGNWLRNCPDRNFHHTSQGLKMRPFAEPQNIGLTSPKFPFLFTIGTYIRSQSSIVNLPGGWLRN